MNINRVIKESEEMDAVMKATEDMFQQLMKAGVDLDRVEELQLKTSEMFSAAVKYAEEKDGKKISCSKGCYFCCHSEIRVSRYEAAYIIEKCSEKKIEPNWKLAKKQNEGDFNKLRWRHKKCAFLDDKGCCKIYDFRPMVCRTHNTFLEPKFCHSGNYPNYNHKEIRGVEMQSLNLALIKADETIHKDYPEKFLHEYLTPTGNE